MQKVIIIPGLGDNTKAIKTWTNTWPKKYGLEPIPYSMEWRNTENFQMKFAKLISFVDKLGCNISIIGCSAGASAALNVFGERREKISRAINVCGRLRRGNQSGFHSFETRTSSSKSFVQSVDRFESLEDSLSAEDRTRIMTVRAFFGDELVPGNTATIRGAQNIAIPTVEHMVSIGAALTLFSGRLATFLKEN